MSIKQRASAKNLPCLFADLVEKYSKVGLKPCETKKSQRWRHVSTQDAAQRLAFYPESKFVRNVECVYLHWRNCQKKQVPESEKDKPDQLTLYRPSKLDEETRRSVPSRISIAQRPSTDRGVNVPEIFIPDPLDINPNSTANIENVLYHIEHLESKTEYANRWL